MSDAANSYDGTVSSTTWIHDTPEKIWVALARSCEVLSSGGIEFVKFNGVGDGTLVYFIRAAQAAVAAPEIDKPEADAMLSDPSASLRVAPDAA